MHHRVFLPGGAAKGFQDGGHVGAGQQFGQLVHRPRDAVVQVGAGNLVEQLAQEGVGLGQLVRRALPREAAAGGQGAARGKQAVAQGLRVHVGKLRFGEGVAHQHVAERLELGMQLAPGAFGLEGFVDEVADQPPEAGHARGQIVRGGLDGQVGLDELGQQLRDLAGGGFVPADFAVLARPRQAGGELAFAIDKPAEVDVVGEDEVGQRFAVAAQLVGGGGLVQADAYVLGLDVAQRQQATGDDEVGRATGNALRLVGGLDGAVRRAADLRAHRFKQGFERRAVRVLGGVAGLQVGHHGFEISLEWRHRIHGLNGRQRLSIKRKQLSFC